MHNIRMLKYHMAPAWLPHVDPVPLGNGLKLGDAPIPQIGSHGIERLVRTSHGITLNSISFSIIQVQLSEVVGCLN
jgi:hypothetical protein